MFKADCVNAAYIGIGKKESRLGAGVVWRSVLPALFLFFAALAKRCFLMDIF